MVTPAATAARTASEPEWKKVPSPDVLGVVRVVGERCHADPLGPLAAHLRHAHLVAPPLVVEGRHDVAADSEADQLVVVGARRDVVGAARTEVRGARSRGVRRQVDADRRWRRCGGRCTARTWGGSASSRHRRASALTTMSLVTAPCRGMRDRPSLSSFP